MSGSKGGGPSPLIVTCTALALRLEQECAGIVQDSLFKGIETASRITVERCRGNGGGMGKSIYSIGARRISIGVGQVGAGIKCPDLSCCVVYNYISIIEAGSR